MQVPHEVGRLDPQDAARTDQHDEMGAEVVPTSRRRRRRGQRGMTTAEYAVGTVATVSLAGVLIHVFTNPEIQKLILELFKFLLKLFWPGAAA